MLIPSFPLAVSPWLRRVLWLALAWVTVRAESALEAEALVQPAYRLSAADAGWTDLIAAFARQPDTLATFEERRHFPFRKAPIVLKGEVRVSAERGLSLHYREPERRVVVLDAEGLLVRGPLGERAPPPDAAAAATQEALRHILRLDFPALEKTFELYGQRHGTSWDLVLVPREEVLQQVMGRVAVTGQGAAVRQLELRRSPRQYVEIFLGAPRSEDAFSPAEVQRFFR